VTEDKISDNETVIGKIRKRAGIIGKKPVSKQK